MTLEEYIKSDKFIWDGINEVHLYVISNRGRYAHNITTIDDETYKVLHCEFIDYDAKPDAYFRDWYECTFIRDCEIYIFEPLTETKVIERAIIVSFQEAK